MLVHTYSSVALGTAHRFDTSPNTIAVRHSRILASLCHASTKRVQALDVNFKKMLKHEQ